MQSTTIGIDLAKSVFQVSVADKQQRIIKRQRLSRTQFRKFIVHTPPACLVMEGCASAHHWGRLAVAHGHDVTLLHAHYVRPSTALFFSVFMLEPLVTAGLTGGSDLGNSPSI